MKKLPGENELVVNNGIGEVYGDSLEILIATLERQSQQGEVLSFQGKVLADSLRNIKRIESDVEFKFSEMKLMVEEARDSITLNYEEQYQLQQIVHVLSGHFAKESFGENSIDVSKEEFLKEVGKFRRAIWKKLKIKMNVPRYPSIKRVDFEESKEFISNLRMKDFLQI